MDNNEVYALFEDIKNGLKGINDRLENAPTVSNGQSEGQVPAMDLAPIKDLFDSSAREHHAQTKAMLTKLAEAEVYASNRILHLLRNMKDSFARSSEERKDEPQEHIHRHSFDIRSSKVFSLFSRHGYRVQPFLLGKHRAMEIQASVCGRCVEVSCHPFMGRLQCQSYPLAE